MKIKIFGKSSREVSQIGLGIWQLGAEWRKPFNREEQFLLA